MLSDAVVEFHTNIIFFFPPDFQTYCPVENFDIGTQFNLKAHATVLITYDRISYRAKMY